MGWLSLFSKEGVSAQTPVYCPTVPDFTDLNQPWVVATTGTTANPLQSTGVVEGRHTVLAEQGLDPFTGSQLRFLPDTESRVVRLGNSQVDAEAETITYRFFVDGSTPVLLLKFAVVFELPAHTIENQPRFILQVLDETGNLLDACTEYDVYSREGIDGFETYHWAGMPILWRDWTHVGLDLSAYAGQKVQVRIATYDCAQRAHFGYGYFTASCVSRKLTMSHCDGERFTLNAPGGFASYQWNSGHIESSLDTVAGVEDVSLSCEITSATGCSFTMSAFIAASGRVPVADTVIWDTLCAGEPYVSDYFNLPPRHEVGTIPYEMTFFDPASCSEGVNLTLYLTTHRRYFDREAMICTGQPYSDKDFTIPSLEFPAPAAGTHVYEKSYPTATGCDSVVRLTLTVSSSFTPVPGITGSTSSCAGNHVHFTVPKTEEDIRYTWGRWGRATLNMGDGTSINVGELCYNLMGGQGTPGATFQYTDYSGIYSSYAYIYCIRENGCGREELRIEPSPLRSYWSTLSESICEGEEFHDVPNGFHIPVIDSAGYYMYPQHGRTVNGCDSIIVLHLTVFDTPEASLTASDSITCVAGDPVTLQAHPNDPSIYRYSWNDEGMLTTNSSREFSPAGSTDYRVTVSQEHLFTFNNLTTLLTCKSSADKRIFVSPDLPELTASICEGESYTDNGFDVSTPGKHTTTIQNSTGLCDIELTLNLTVRDTSYTSLTATITEGEYYTGWFYTVQEPKLYRQLLKNRVGCDSLVTLALRVISRDTVLYGRICEGDSYTGEGFHTAPVHSDTVCIQELTNSIGGDSTVTLYLTVIPQNIQNYTRTICSAELPYTWNSDTTFGIGTTSGVFRFQRTSAVTGCDSIVYLGLTVNDSVVKNYTRTICSAELPYTWNSDTTFGVGTKSGVYRLQRSSAVTGCDSIIWLDLTVNDSIVQNEEEAICESGLPYKWRDTIFDAGSVSGFFRFQRSSVVTGCDSIIYLNLIVNDSIIKSESLTVCRSELPVDWRDTTFDVGTESGTFCFRRVSHTMHCDSIVWLNLTVNDSIVQYEEETICANDLPYPWRDTIFDIGTKTGDFCLRRISAVTGCDSIVRLHLTVHSVDNTVITDTVCHGSPYHNGPFSYATVTGDRHEVRVLSGTNGCDSIVELLLHAAPVYLFTDRQVICEGGSYDFRGRPLTAGGIYADTLRTVAAGCDSIYRLELAVNPVFDTVVNGEVCEGDRYIAYGFDETVTGTYYQYLLSTARCDSTVQLNLVQKPNLKGTIHSKRANCEEYNYLFSVKVDSLLTDALSLPVQSYRWDFGDGDGSDLPAPGHHYSRIGVYPVEVAVTAANACRNVLTHKQEVFYFLEYPPIYSDKTEITDEDPEVRLWTFPADGVRFIWDFGDSSTGEGEEVTHLYNVVGDQEFVVRLQAVNADSCIGEERLVLPAFPHIAPPNTFSPNDDGFYDRFMPGMRVKIVNRNGVVLYEGEDGWDGTYQGKKVAQDTYFYELYYRQKGREKTKKGYITVVL